MRALAGFLALLAVSCDAQEDVSVAPQGQTPSSDGATFSDRLVTSEEVREGKVWQGTIGDLPITACFYDDKSNEGAYYYDKSLIPLRLVEHEEGDPSTLNEVEGFSSLNGAIWEIARKTGDDLEGTWRQGDKELPINLSSMTVQVTGYFDDCSSNAFVAPLVEGGTVERSKASFENVTYTKLIYTGPKRPGVDDYTFSSLEIENVRPGDDVINKTLRAFLPDGSKTDAMVGCVGMSIPTGQLGYSEAIAQPTVLTPDWLGISRSGSQFCGGARPSHFLWFAVYDRQSGGEVDPSTWFKEGALAFYDFESEPGDIDKRPVQATSNKLLDAIIANWPDDPDVGNDQSCADREFLRSGWQLGLSQKGVIFVHEFPHVVFACTAEVVVPWEELEPFLSKEGLKVRDSLR